MTSTHVPEPCDGHVVMYVSIFYDKHAYTHAVWHTFIQWFILATYPQIHNISSSIASQLLVTTLPIGVSFCPTSLLAKSSQSIWRISAARPHWRRIANFSCRAHGAHVLTSFKIVNCFWSFWPKAWQRDVEQRLTRLGNSAKSNLEAIEVLILWIWGYASFHVCICMYIAYVGAAVQVASHRLYVRMHRLLQSYTQRFCSETMPSLLILLTIFVCLCCDPLSQSCLHEALRATGKSRLCLSCYAAWFDNMLYWMYLACLLEIKACDALMAQIARLQC